MSTLGGQRLRLLIVCSQRAPSRGQGLEPLRITSCHRSGKPTSGSEPRRPALLSRRPWLRVRAAGWRARGRSQACFVVE